MTKLELTWCWIVPITATIGSITGLICIYKKLHDIIDGSF